MVDEGIKYDYSKKGKLKKESFLRNGLVDDYLSKKTNKQFYNNNISNSFDEVEISFSKEENQVYQIDEIPADDFIDICIRETELSKLLGHKGEDEIKFAIECKRINKSSDYNEYIKDIEKFAQRPFNNFRLPIEGQIAFVENKDLKHSKIKLEINQRLNKHNSIITTQPLSFKNLIKTFEASYISKHLRNHGNKNSFLVYHLLFDYSNIIKP